MLARNALAAVVAATLTATALGAQQPARQPTTKPSATARAQQPTQKAKADTSSKSHVAVSADSAKKVLLANAPGATVSSERLRRSNGKRYYMFTYREKGNKQAMHASVDASTGAFSMTTPATSPTKTPSKKKSS